MKHILITFFILLSTHGVFGKKTHTDCPKVYRSSKEVADTSCQCLKRIHANKFNNTVVAVNMNNTKAIIPFDSVWGYRQKNDYPVRVVSKTEYIMLRNAPVYIYKTGTLRISSYYFSTSLDGALHKLSKKNLKQVFTDNSVYEQIVNNKNVKRFL